MKNTFYFHWIDIAKGIGITLVILGHCIFPCHAVIDIFHMPLFFLLAGITFHMKTSGDFLIGKINRIFVPYVFWAIISAILNFMPHNYGGVFNGPLWFLPVMFSTLITLYIINLTHRKVQFLIIALFLILSWIFVENTSLTVGLPFSLNLVILSSVYMFIGQLYSSYFKSEMKCRSIIGMAMGSLLLFSILFLWLYSNYDLKGAYVSLGLYESNFLVVLICSLLGIFATIFISKLIGKSQILEWLGQNSLVLMCVHFPFSNSINVYVSKMALYDTLYGKISIALVEYIIVFGISIVLTIMCKKYLPKITGYRSLINCPTSPKDIIC